jgi:hypothetical protein
LIVSGAFLTASQADLRDKRFFVGAHVAAREPVTDHASDGIDLEQERPGIPGHAEQTVLDPLDQSFFHAPYEGGDVAAIDLRIEQRIQFFSKLAFAGQLLFVDQSDVHAPRVLELLEPVAHDHRVNGVAVAGRRLLEQVAGGLCRVGAIRDLNVNLLLCGGRIAAVLNPGLLAGTGGGHRLRVGLTRPLRQRAARDHAVRCPVRAQF